MKSERRDAARRCSRLDDLCCIVPLLLNAPFCVTAPHGLNRYDGVLLPSRELLRLAHPKVPLHLEHRSHLPLIVAHRQQDQLVLQFLNIVLQFPRHLPPNATL